MFLNPLSTVSTPSLNTNLHLFPENSQNPFPYHHPSQLNFINQTNIFSVPSNPPNNSFENLPSQSITSGPMKGGGGLRGNPQSSENLFNNQIQQKAQDGCLVGSVPQQFGKGGSVFGGNRFSLRDKNDIKANGIVEYIPKNKEGLRVASITARIRNGYSLDELRTIDYFHLKNNTIAALQKNIVSKIINKNLNSIDVHSHFSSTDLHPNLATLFNDSNVAPSDQKTNNSPSRKPSETQNSFTMTEKVLSIKNPFLDQTDAENLSIQKRSFNYGFNKMAFMSGLVQIMEKHNMAMPENLLDKTDFIPQFLEFLGQYGVSFPTENIPQFQIDSTHLLTLTRDECE